MNKLEKLRECGISPKLVDAVLEQLVIEPGDGGTELLDIAQHGIDGGYSGFTYYSDTLEFWNKHRLEIRKLAQGIASECDLSMLSMIASFNCLKHLELNEDQVAEVIYTDEDTEDRTQILNAMAWFAAEEVARRCEVICEEGEG